MHENRTFRRLFLLLTIIFPGRLIFIQFVPVHGQLGADGPAEERVDGDTERLADDVEEGVLDGTDGLQGTTRYVL